MFSITWLVQHGDVYVLRVSRECFWRYASLGTLDAVAVDVAQCIWVSEAELIWGNANDLSIALMRAT
jgi:hypothetical protein